MFKIIDKIKNVSIFGKKEISTAVMSEKEYVAAIEGEIIPYWIDEELMRKTGIKNLFSKNERDAEIINDLSLEDALECVERASKMMEVLEYVIDRFKKGMGRLSEDAILKKTTVDQTYYSATTIRNLFIEGKDVVNVDNENIRAIKTVDVAVNELNAMLMCIREFKDIAFKSMISFAALRGAHMIGFID